MGAVDLARQPFQPGADLLIAFHRAPRWRRDLEQNHFLAFFRVLAQEPFVTQEALFQALGIVEPVHSDDQRAADRAFAHPNAGFPRRFAFGQGLEFRRVDTGRADQQLQAMPVPRGHVVF